MPRWSCLALLAAALVLAPPSRATAQERPAVGLGVAINPLEIGGTSPTIEVYVPLRVAPNLRFEPSLGVRTVDTPDTDGSLDTRDVTLGLGLFVMQRAAGPFDLYAGGRLKLNFAKFTRHAVTGGVLTSRSDSGTDIAVAAALGGEDFLSTRFSIGAEAQLGYYSNSTASATGEQSGFFTTGLAFLRFYFM